VILAYPSPVNQFFWTARRGVPGYWFLARFVRLLSFRVSSPGKRLSPLGTENLGQAGVSPLCGQGLGEAFLYCKS
jgi:hypothetical protein